MADLRRTLHGMYPSLLHRRILSLCRPLTSADDRARVAHAAPGRGGLPSDESHDRLFHVRLDVIRSNLLGIPADFANHHDRLRASVLIEHLNRVEEASPDDRVAADADARRLSDAHPRELVHGLIGQRPAPAHEPPRPGLVNVTGHDSDFALAR